MTEDSAFPPRPPAQAWPGHGQPLYPLVAPPPPPPVAEASKPSASPPHASIPAGLPRTLESIVEVAHQSHCSDVHLGVGEEPRLRLQGDMLQTGWSATDATSFQGWIAEMLTPMEIHQFQREKEFDGSFSFPFTRVRINLLDSLKGPGMVLRLIPYTVPTIDELELPDVLKVLVDYPKGLVLLTGPTGSGKTTTLAAMIDWINTRQKKHILTIEDPVEYVHASKQCLVRQREVGRNTMNFHTALRASVREDPDVILIGEIRDRETLSTALEAAQTGHLVFGTLHTNSAVRTVERLLGMYPPDQQENVRRTIAESLLAVLSQGLLKTTDNKRVPYHDIFINNDACRDYVLRGDLDEIENIMGRSSFEGMQTINQSLARLVASGRVSEENAMAVSLRPNELAQVLRGRI